MADTIKNAIEAYVAVRAESEGINREKSITAERKKCLAILKAGGYDSFVDWSQKKMQAQMDELQRCYKMTGKCDGCVGRKHGCYTACVDNRVKENGQVWRWLDFFAYQQFDGHMPYNCGLRFEKIAEPTFDIYEDMGPGYDKEAFMQILNKVEPK